MDHYERIVNIFQLSRAVIGLGIGLMTPINSVYLREISDSKTRSHLFILNCLLWNGGTFLVFVLGYLLPWRLVAVPGFVFPLIPVLFFFLIPETPTWLLTRWYFCINVFDTKLCAGGREIKPSNQCFIFMVAELRLLKKC